MEPKFACHMQAILDVLSGGGAGLFIVVVVMSGRPMVIACCLYVEALGRLLDLLG
jgi:hypothetical protein